MRFSPEPSELPRQPQKRKFRQGVPLPVSGKGLFLGSQAENKPQETLPDYQARGAGRGSASLKADLVQCWHLFRTGTVSSFLGLPEACAVAAS